MRFAIDRINDNIVTLEQRNNFKVGDVIQFFGPHTETFDYTVTEIVDEDGNNIYGTIVYSTISEYVGCKVLLIFAFLSS